MIFGSLFSCLIFFLITHFGFWLGSGMYDLSINRMLICYIAALPFFRQTLVSTLLWSSIIEGLLFYLKKLKLNLCKNLSLGKIKC